MADWKLCGDVLASARQAANLSQTAVALAIGMSDGARISVWEHGDARPQARVIPVLAELLGVDALALLDGDPKNPDLVHLRVATGLSLQEMAVRTGLPIASYHRLERRGAPRGGLGKDIAEALSRTLGITPERVLEALDRGHR